MLQQGQCLPAWALEILSGVLKDMVTFLTVRQGLLFHAVLSGHGVGFPE